MKMGKTIWPSMRSDVFWILQFWELFCQPFGENTFPKNAPETKNENLENYKAFKQPNYRQLGCHS